MNNHQRRWVGSEGWPSSSCCSLTIFITPNTPDATAGPAQVAKFVHANQGGLYLNAYLTSLAVLIAGSFLWYLREVVAPALPGRRLANLGFAGGILFLVEGIFSAGAAFAMADVANHADPNVLQTLNIFSMDVTNIAGGATALLLGATSLAILRSKALPSWLAYVGLVLAVASFAIPMLGLPVVAVWWLLTSIAFSSHRERRQVTGETRSLSLTSTSAFKRERNTMRKILMALTAGVITIPAAASVLNGAIATPTLAGASSPSGGNFALGDCESDRSHQQNRRGRRHRRFWSRHQR